MRLPRLNPLTRRRLARKLLLAFSVLVFVLAALESSARLFLPPHLLHLRDGIYVSSLPLVNGRRAPIEVTQGEPLPVEKAPGELRVFMFGESSVAGAPWGPMASPATILHDALVRLSPGRRFTVVNMGRSNSVCMDSYYYLAGIARFRPDFVVFYQGVNDRFDLDPEVCRPANHPGFYRAWRWMVEHSRLLWAVRVLGPDALGWQRLSGVYVEPGEQPCGDDTVALWMDLLVETAVDAGARVVVASPVRNALLALEYEMNESTRGQEAEEVLRRLADPYRELLRCAVDAGCDFANAAGDALWSVGESHLFMQLNMSFVHDAWKASAERHGAVFVPFDHILASLSPGGILGPPMVIDDAHLSIEGYALLAERCALAIRQLLEGDHPTPLPAPAIPEVARYYRDVGDHVGIRTAHALLYAKKRMFLLAAWLLREPAEAGNTTALLALGWLRLGVGLPSGLPPELEESARQLDLDSAVEGSRRPGGRDPNQQRNP